MLNMAKIMEFGVARRQREWERDRSETVGASEVGQCIRKTYFSKHGYEPDPSYVDGWGAKERGNLIENHHWVPALLEWVSENSDTWAVDFIGGEQETLVDGYLSATPDGLLMNVSDDPQEIFGIILAPGEGIAIECKSIDPRVNLKDEAKEEHIFQTHVQVGMLRSLMPNVKIGAAHITYSDASFLDHIEEFIVPFDQEVYNAAKFRARQVMMATDPLQLRPEGKLAGGKDCQYCPFQAQCAGANAFAVPAEDNEVEEDVKDHLATLAVKRAALKEQSDAMLEEVREIEESIREILREAGTRRVTGHGFSISYSSVKGRVSVDTKAAEADGVDLSKYKKEGNPSDRLTIKVTQ